MPLTKNLKNFLVNICLLLVVLFFCFLLLELGLRGFYPQALLYVEYNETYCNKLIPNSEFTIYNPQPQKECSSANSINSQGLRENGEIPYETESYRVAFVGDSFVYGFCVEKESGVVEVLEEKFEGDIDVVNFGVPGWDPAKYFLYIQEEVLLFNPDLIIVNILTSNDIMADQIVTFGAEGYTVDTCEKGFLFDFRRLLASNLHSYKFFVTLWRYSALNPSNYNPQTCPSFIGITSLEEYDQKLNYTLLVMGKIVELSEEIPVIFLLAPPQQEVDLDIYNSYIEEFGCEPEIGRLRAHDDIMDYSLEKGWYIFDLAPYLDNEHYFQMDKHWNEEGHSAVAELVYDFLLNEGLVPNTSNVCFDYFS